MLIRRATITGICRSYGASLHFLRHSYKDFAPTEHVTNKVDTLCDLCALLFNSKVCPCSGLLRDFVKILRRAPIKFMAGLHLSSPT